MKYIYAVHIALYLTVANASAGGFPVQNYGNDFMNSFNQTQEFMLRQRQTEQMNSDREYQQRMLKIEEKRLELEQVSADTKKHQKSVKEQTENEWLAAVVVFIDRHPEYDDKEKFKELSALLKDIPLSDDLGTAELKLARLELGHNYLIAKLNNKKTWDNFIAVNPLFADANSKYRKYGDYLFETEYSEKIKSGELSYSQALNIIATETYKVIGKIKEEAPRPAPAVEAPKPYFSN